MALLRTLCWALIFILRLRFPPGSSLASIAKDWINLIGDITLLTLLKLNTVSFSSSCTGNETKTRHKYQTNQNMKECRLYHTCEQNVIVYVGR